MKKKAKITSFYKIQTTDNQYFMHFLFFFTPFIQVLKIRFMSK